MMNKRQIEAWALRVIDQVKRQQAHEDSLIELKAVWPADIHKAARQIAGHANSAHGEPVLWLIGVNEKTGPVICPPVNLANWLASLNAEFSELAPTITDVNVPVDNMVVTALLVETDRAPYVVKNASFGQASGGQISLEVPWRDGTAVRTARRQDLLKLLLPVQELPIITVINGGIVVWDEGEYGNKLQPAHWSLESQLYIEPLQRHDVVFPYHRQECFIDIGTQVDKLCVKLEMKDAFRNYRQIECTPTEAIVRGPGSVTLFGKLNEARLPREFSQVIRVTVHLSVTGSDVLVAFDHEFTLDNDYHHDAYSGPHPHARIVKGWKAR